VLASALCIGIIWRVGFKKLVEWLLGLHAVFLFGTIMFYWVVVINPIIYFWIHNARRY
jgi:hypothetical protein